MGFQVPDDRMASSGVLDAVDSVVMVLFVFLRLWDDPIPEVVAFGSERVVPRGMLTSEIVCAD